MNTENPVARPRYFRLLEKGETIKEGDMFILHPSHMKEEKLDVVTEGIGRRIGDYQPRWAFFRPVTADPWISYAEQKPTKEDKDENGEVQYFTDRGLSYCLSNPTRQYGNVTHWRKISPPTPAKPKSATVELLHVGRDQRVTAPITVNADGTVKLDCGNVISAESIEEFIKARAEVMKQ